MTPDSARSRAPQVATRDVPAIPIPGWEVGWDDGDFVATRITPLSRYQESYGALREIWCGDAGELWLLCDAQTRLAERLTTAEQIHETDRKRRIDALESPRQDRPRES